MKSGIGTAENATPALFLCSKKLKMLVYFCLFYGQQMDELQLRLKELKESATRYTEVKYWLDRYKTHIQSGESMNTDDAVMLRSLVEKIIVYDEHMEIHLRCGAVMEERYK